MKHAAIVLASLVLLVGCGRKKQEPQTKAPSDAPVPAATAPRNDKPLSPPVKPAKQGVKPSAVPTAAAKPDLPKNVVRIPSGSTNRQASIDSFLMPAGFLPPESAAGGAFAKAQDLFLQGQTNAAVDVLTEAVNNPSNENGRPVLIRKLVALLLSSGRVDDARAACIAYAKDEKSALGASPIAPPYHLVTQYLIEEKGDADAAVAWTEQLAKLPLSGLAASANVADYLSALYAAKRVDEIMQSVPVILAYTNEVWSASLVRSVASDMIAHSDFDSAGRFLSAVEASANGRAAYADTIGSMRKQLESARATPAE